MLIARLFLLLAIVAEVAGTSTMSFIGESNTWEGYLVMYALIAISYYFLSKATKKISIGVAYAIWEGLGIVLITLVSIVLFDANLNIQQLCGLALAVIGIVCVTFGETHEQPPQKNEQHCSSHARCES